MMMMTNIAERPRFKVNIHPNILNVRNIKWGDVVYVNFGEPVGSEQGGVRPAIVVSNNIGNSTSPCIAVAPITSEYKKPIPTHIIIYPTRATGLKTTSTVMLEQVRTIDKSRILSKIGHLEAESLISKIESSLKIAFDKNLS